MVALLVNKELVAHDATAAVHTEEEVENDLIEVGNRRDVNVEANDRVRTFIMFEREKAKQS